MVNQDDSDYLVAEEIHLDEEDEGPVKKYLPAAIMGIAGIGIAILCWYAYQEGKVARTPGEPPIIKAETAPYKKKPENPGGMDIPHTDKEVFESLSAKDADKVEPVLQGDARQEMPKQEAPVDRTTLKPIEMTQDAATAAAMEESSGAVADMAEVEQAKTEEEKSAPVYVPTIETPAKSDKDLQKTKTTTTAKTAEANAVTSTTPPEPKPVDTKPIAIPVPTEATVTEPAAEKTQTAKPAASGRYRLQLGAFRTEGEARSEWDKLQKRHGSLLTGLSYDIERADLQEKGIYFRLRAGSISARADADLICKRLTAKGQGCFVVRAK